MKMKKIMNKRRKTLAAAGLLAAAILLISGCSAGVSKEQRLELFIAEMESGAGANPREHFADDPNAADIDSNTFNSTDMAPDDGLDITGFDIDGVTFTMDFTTTTYPEGLTVYTASFYSEANDLGGEDWYIRSMTVPVGGGSDFVVIP